MWATFVQISVFIGLSVLDLYTICAKDKLQTDVRQHYRWTFRLGGGDNNCKTQNKQLTIQPLSNFACCSRVAATIGSAPLFCSWAPKVVAQPRRRQRTRSFPRPTCSHAHRCTRVKRQHDGEERGSVTSTVDLLTLIVMSVSRGLPLYQFWSS